MGTAVVLLDRAATVVGAGLGGVTARQDCEGSRPSRVGQASDQASDVVGQAGAGSSRALRGKGTSPTARYEWATRAAGVSLPCQAATKATGIIVEDGRLRSEPLSLPAPTRSVAQAGTQAASQFRTAILREDLVSLSDFRSRTHPESDPANATPCHSLLLAGQAILGADLHEWLFLLVTA
jgi:hypothetical protein